MLGPCGWAVYEMEPVMVPSSYDDALIGESVEHRRLRHRRRILDVSRQVTAAHVAPAFSCVDIVDAIYASVLRPHDTFIMSKGHGCLAQYVVLEDYHILDAPNECDVCGGAGLVHGSVGSDVCSHCGGLRYLQPPMLDGYCQPDGRLGAHPDRAPEMGVHASTGSLGHGLGMAVGIAYAEKVLRRTDARVYVLLSDGECQEGSTWEAVMVAANLSLSNLCVLVDYNNWGGMDRMSDRFPALDPIEDKFVAFGWDANRLNGHHPRLASHISDLVSMHSCRPRACICTTVKGRGVSFMQDNPIWHYRSPSDEEYEAALAELTPTEEVPY